MSAIITAYYDFRSPYAYFANYRICAGSFALPPGFTWRWRPVSIDVLLNLQAGREAWAQYVDPLSGPKRAHLIADVRRNAAFYGAPLRPPKPQRPNSIAALCAAAQLDPEGHEAFRKAVFAALWQEQRDIADPQILAECLSRAGRDPDLAYRSISFDSRATLTAETETAYANGIFGVPTFVYETEVFFGNDRLEMLNWRLRRENPVVRV
ncbi:DsbA family protein [Bradyrhizobium sp. UFLA05-109]